MILTWTRGDVYTVLALARIAVSIDCCIDRLLYRRLPSRKVHRWEQLKWESTERESRRIGEGWVLRSAFLSWGSRWV